MNETLKQVYELLEVKCEPVIHEGRDYFCLTRNGTRVGMYCPSEESAWCYGPSFKDLRDSLEDVMINEEFSVLIICARPAGYCAVLEETQYSGSWTEQSDPHPTRHQAIASLFVVACKAGLIDPKRVLLPQLSR